MKRLKIDDAMLIRLDACWQWRDRLRRVLPIVVTDDEEQVSLEAIRVAHALDLRENEIENRLWWLATRLALEGRVHTQFTGSAVVGLSFQAANVADVVGALKKAP